MAEMALPPDDEPFDFRRQAATYGRYRRDYSAGLYDVIGEHTGAAAGRFAVDLGCGTGFVASTLTRRGWRAVGVDFSAPMLAQARTLAVVQARHQHRQLFVQLSRLERARDELNIEFGRLQLEQATWAESNRIDQVARDRLGMKFPEGAETVVIRP